MKILLKISWRNIWRNTKRSIVMMLAVAVGLWGGIFSSSISKGLINQRFASSIEQHISHIQIHNPEYIKVNNIQNSLGNYEDLLEFLENQNDIKAFSARTVVNGMLATANLTKGINIISIVPAYEAQTTKLDENILEGSFFDAQIRYPILIGKKLADKTKLNINSRLVLTFQNQDNDLVSASFRVAGIFQTSNTMYDELNVYITNEVLNELINSTEYINEIAIVANTLEEIKPLSINIKEHFPEYEVRTWDEISPELSYMHEMTDFMLMIIIVIILLALSFGLINTMLMSVYERMHELGMLMAIGMNKIKVFTMLLFETTFITFMGAIFGMLIAYITIKIFGNIGINLGAIGGDSLNEFGYASMVYPYLELSFFFKLTILVFFTVLFTTIFPAVKAIRLRPAEAVKID